MQKVNSIEEYQGMVSPVKAIKTLKRWQIVALGLVLIGAGGSAYTVYGKTNGPGLEGLTENQEIITAQYGDLVNQVSTNGSLVFPEKEGLAFGTEGEIVELLVQEGQRVSKGDLLAKLDQVTVASLEKAVAQARLDLQSAEEVLEDIQQAGRKLITRIVVPGYRDGLGRQRIRGEIAQHVTQLSCGSIHHANFLVNLTH